ncbi:MAG: hypothetical protein ACI379_14600 [Nocardioides sp.]|uniref:hypothetical protein n=1 Tax=Nocardioides sp. TaxID=35761 RepID=UPI003EFCD60B
MTYDVESEITRELRSVADSVTVPPMPRLGAEESAPVVPLVRRASTWLVAAAVLVAAGVGTAWWMRPDPDAPQPAPSPTVTDSPSPEPTATDTPGAVPTGAPTVPYVVNGELWVDGEQVEGEWAYLQVGRSAWVAMRDDGSWWYGRAARAQRLDAPGAIEQGVAVSPSGDLVATVVTVGSTPYVWGVETASGDEFGGAGSGAELPTPPDGPGPWIAAVTDARQVITRDGGGNHMYLVGSSAPMVLLADQTPGWTVVAGTSLGPVVSDAQYAVDAQEGDVRLAEITQDGTIETTASVRPHAALSTSEFGTWMAWIGPGTLGGEAAGVREVSLAPVGSGTAGPDDTVLRAPGGWLFTSAGTWEDDRYVVFTVVSEQGTERVVRCDAQAAACVVID